MPTGSSSAAGRGACSPEQLETLLAARAFAYDLLKCAFLQEPTPEFIALLVEGQIMRAFPFADGDSDAARALQKIVQGLEHPQGQSCDLYERLRWDYTRMFVGPGPVPAPPWESVYRDPQHLHFAEETLAVRAAYRQYHLAHTEFGREPDDHIGLELDFLHKLCETAQDRVRHNDEAGLVKVLRDQQAFLDEHLLQWVPAWSIDVMRSAESDFYQGMAALLDAYLRVDRALVAELLATLPPTAPEIR